MMKIPIVCLAVALNAFMVTPARAQDVLPLGQAIASALTNSRLLETADVEAKKIEARIASIRTRRLPSSKVFLFGGPLINDLNFTFKQGQFGAFPSTGPVPPQDTDVRTSRRLFGLAVGQVDQPLFRFSQVHLGVRLQEMDLDLNREKVRQQRQEIAHQVRQLYYRILEQESALEASAESARQYRELDRVMSVSLESQTVLKSDVLDVRLLLAQEEYNRLTLGNAIAEAKEALNRLLGRDVRAAFRTEPLPESTTLDLTIETAESRALQQRPELRQAELRMRQADYDRQFKKAEQRPEFNFSFRYITPINVETLPKNIAVAGVGLNWEPWDWGRRKNELAEKDRTIDQTRKMRDETRSQILLEVNQRFRKVEETRALLRLNEAANEAAQEKLRVAGERYAAQTILLKDLMQAQVAVAEVRKRRTQALLAFWAARADLDKALGEDP